MAEVLDLGTGLGTSGWVGIRHVAIDVSPFSILPAPVDYRPAADPGYSLYRSL